MKVELNGEWIMLFLKECLVDSKNEQRQSTEPDTERERKVPEEEACNACDTLFPQRLNSNLRSYFARTRTLIFACLLVV
jgi:hypothetical protein